jgi:hypothetical protein
MSKFRKKPVIVEATRWWKNGDHPDDMVGKDWVLIEGKVVRRYNDPNTSGHALCVNCNRRLLEHGWIDTLEGGHIVCPGDWVITGIKGERYPCKPDIFAATYEAVP